MERDIENSKMGKVPNILISYHSNDGRWKGVFNRHCEEYQKKHQKYPDYKHCVECGKIFQVNPRKRKRHKTCSKECAQKMRVRGMMKGRGVW